MSMKQRDKDHEEHKKHEEKINMKDEFSKEDYKNDQFQVRVNLSKQVNLSLFKMIKYSEIIQEEINKNDIIKKIEEKIQKINNMTKIKEENIKTFFEILNEEEIEINNNQYNDLLKLSNIFKINTLNKYLMKYAKNHSNDIEFIINQIQANINDEREYENDSDNNSSEFEKCLIDKINECLTNEKFNELPISIIYRIIKSKIQSKTKTSNEIDNNLLYDFIENKKEERYILYKFLNLEELGDDKFDELYENYINDQKSKSTNIKYYEYLQHNLIFIKKLKDENKSLKNQLENLQIDKEQLQTQNKQILTENEQHQIQLTQTNKENQELKTRITQVIEENQQFKTENQKMQTQMTQTNNENQNLMTKINQINEENQQLKIENEKINKNNEQLQMKANQMNEENKKLKMRNEGHKFEFDGQPNHRFNGIIHHLQGSEKTNICDRRIINVTASSCFLSNFPKYTVEFDNNNYFISDSSNDWLKYDFKEKKIHPTHYSIKTRHNSDGCNPVNWFIEVSNTDKDNDWRVIDSRKGVTSVSKRNQSDTFDISTHLSDNEFYRYIRFRCDGDTSSNCTWLAISSLEFFGNLIE